MNAEPDRAVLVTGCTSGIGRCVALGLRARGYRVFASARKAADVRALAAAGFEALPLDLTGSASIGAAVDTLLARTGGRIYGLFNNAGYGQPGAVEDLSRDALREQFETNLFGTHELTCRVLKAMRAQGKGRIIQNSSMLGYVALKFRGAYNASKFALEGLTDTLRLELAGTGIHISLIEPGPVASQFRENSRKALHRRIRTRGSAHEGAYLKLAERLDTEGPAVPFTLPPEAVLKAVVHGLEAPRPRIRYRVTVPSHLFAVLKRSLPDFLLDKVLLAASGSESNQPGRTI